MIGNIFKTMLHMKKILSLVIVATGLFVQCTDNKEEMVELAKHGLTQSVAFPEQLKILGVSEPDSAFGADYYTKKEIRGIMTMMAKVSAFIMKRTNNMTAFNPEDVEVMELAERQMAATAAIRSMIMQSEKKGEWSGWKVKIDYQCKNKNGHQYRAEKWFFLDKAGKRVEKTFELPLP